MSLLKKIRGTSRRGATAVVVAAGLMVGATAIVPSAGADEIGDKQSEARQVADQLEALQARLMDVSAQAEKVSYERSLAEQEVAEAQSLLDQTNGELETKRGAVRDAAVEAYQSGNDSPEFDAFLTSDANTGLQKRTYLESRTGDMRDVVDELSAVQQKAEDDKARLEEAQEAVEAKAAELEALREASSKAVADQQAVNAKVQGELQTLVAEEQQRRAEEAQRAAAAQQAAAAARQAQAQAEAPATQAQGQGRAPAPAVAAPAPPRAGAGTGGGNQVVVPSNPAPPPVGSRAQGAISAALSRVGKGTYVWGAAGPNNFDCSGIVLWAYAQVGVSLPHYSGAQYNMTTRISASQLQPGDLVFWGSGGSEHVAIYMGGNQLVHAFGSGNGVRVTALAGWWKPPTGYGRINY
jgi:cell wall-associated NlpC family hydrolase